MIGKRGPRALKDDVICDIKEPLVKYRLRASRNSTLATGVTFTDSSVNGISVISPERNH